MPERRYVLGLDLSLTRAAAVLVPLDFEGDFATLEVAVAGHGLHNEADEIARDARCREVAETIEELVVGRAVAGAFVEDYAFSRGRGAHHHALGELRAIVRRTLVARYGWAPRPVSASTVRKLFFGKTPRPPEGAKRDWLKAFILASVRACGATFRKDDEADAFLVANFGLSELGGVSLTLGDGDGKTSPATAASGGHLRDGRGGAAADGRRSARQKRGGELL